MNFGNDSPDNEGCLVKTKSARRKWMKMKRATIMVAIFLFTMSSFITSCGHLANPAPPKVELSSAKDQSYSCQEINTEILDMQTKRINTQKQLDNQKAQNIVSGIGGWLVIVPFVFIDVTTEKNASYNSYAEREEYLRKLATDKNCTDLPKPYEFPSTTKQTVFIPSGGNTKQDGTSQKFTKPTRVTEDGYTVWEIVGKGMDIDFNRNEAEGRPILGKDIAVGDAFIVQGKEFKLLQNSGWITYYNEYKSSYKTTLPSMKPIGIRAPEGESVVIMLLKQPQK
jgi:hypothetical protein